jgi:hypothetical protein
MYEYTSMMTMFGDFLLIQLHYFGWVCLVLLTSRQIVKENLKIDNLIDKFQN